MGMTVLSFISAEEMHSDEKHVFNWVSQSELVSKNLEKYCLKWDSNSYFLVTVTSLPTLGSGFDSLTGHFHISNNFHILVPI